MELDSSCNIRRDMDLEILTNQIEEGLSVKFTKEELKEASKDFANSPVVKLIGGRSYNRAAFKTVLSELWNPDGGLRFTKI